jgi:hypothetical protein
MSIVRAPMRGVTGFSFSWGESMPRTLFLRLTCRIVALVMVIGVLGGCGGESSQTAEFPKMGKANLPASTLKKPEKGMDRIGSESGPAQ